MRYPCKVCGKDMKPTYVLIYGRRYNSLVHRECIQGEEVNWFGLNYVLYGDELQSSARSVKK